MNYAIDAKKNVIGFFLQNRMFKNNCFFLLLYFYMHLSNAINDFISQSIPFNFRHLDLLNIKQFLQLDLI